ncbi:ABC transporter permease [Polluticoccus soli]|uniref:ABC transporter permease n=1 Tax=Polluticoccus soli TaxID=3034150 RepID=UPI0023E292D0|nr:ABC transporter permease [Flavipsychrobacter sp. JY13-12]
MLPQQEAVRIPDAEIEWDQVISGSKPTFSINFAEIWRYRDLLVLFVRRDVVTVYKQTVLGPAWFFVQPVLTSLIFAFVFGNLAGISTGGVPQLLFYLCGITIWNFFSDTLNSTSRTFTDNAGIFGKVYFPRMILPLSKAISGFFKFLIQFAFFLVVWAYYVFVEKSVSPNSWMLIAPFLVVLMALIGLALGIIITSMTTKYRDLVFLVGFGVQLLMYASPVIYPVASLPEKYQSLMWFNPLTSIFETFKYAFLGNGILSIQGLVYSTVCGIVLFVCGIFVFNKVEHTFVDTV